ncbi:MAG TPA: VOC family protein [Candidatus Acidoferrales bacterium]|jgi:PhnB protein|nr:VOC family protein [Candidatus Acidoferrales bacterium]
MKNESLETETTFFAPHLTLRNVLAGVEFYQAAFGAVELRRFSNPDGTVHVAEMSINDALFHLHEEVPGKSEFSPQTLKGTTSAIGLFVPDPAATVKRAVAAGARETSPVTDYDYGYRQGTVTDIAGHIWLIQKKI